MNRGRLRVFESEEEIDALLDLISGLGLPNEEFTHREHLAFASSLALSDPKGSFERIKAGIMALNKSNNVGQTPTGGYHETLTVAWHSLISAHIASLPVETPRRLVVNSVLNAFADKRVILNYYSKDLIMSWTARIEFVPPDITPLPEVAP